MLDGTALKVRKARVPTWMLRGGPGRDYPCENPNIVECATSDCQHLGRCKLRRADEQSVGEVK